MNSRYWWAIAGLLIVVLGVLLVWWKWPEAREWVSPLPLTQTEKPLAKYSFERLRQKDYQGGEITVDGDDQKENLAGILRGSSFR
ncbi:MAG: hypothetical protein A2784_04500 [Candidatus Chisholmbacteria bacterium RIFCSPHIGHO2_01_FULL_48_12]|uniref:Uncharacterized protein n=1 Tax=Candidatus Chisholmbacteria bacterium RIFCSPHIGHO2_01_FULL_48_12 TaxID=1797589 RepID=A0A1G1VJX8_9BACT|nr:MAG: hypothetical protein A2784_04500 [Candidatus Chisholmbacteria bacterium RIFCSPHIGHO2_01_FULL_48_12]